MMTDDSSQQLEAVNSNAVSPLESIERANIDMQISTARRYPRTLSKVKADMTSFATLDEETAQGCFYTVPRGGKTIQGPSVRLAEIAVSCYGNLRAGARVIETVTTGDNPHVVVQAIAHDLEKNVAITLEKRRRIVGKKSKGGKVDEDDINLACNACTAVAFRDAVFKVIPMALIKPVCDIAKRVAVGDVKSLVAKRSEVLTKLKQMGAKEANILALVGAAKVEDIDLEKLGTLIGVGTALKEGELTLEEAFPEPRKDLPAPGSLAAAVGGAPTPALAPEVANQAQSAPAEATPEPTIDRDALVKEIENLLFDNGVPESKLFDYAHRMKMVPEGIVALFELPTKDLAKLKLAIPSLSTAKKGGVK